MRFLDYIVGWALMAAMIGVLALYRRMVARNEDDSLHLAHGAALVPKQEELARRLEAIDKWGKLLTLIVAVTGVVLLGVILYSAWIDGQHIAG